MTHPPGIDIDSLKGIGWPRLNTVRRTAFIAIAVGVVLSAVGCLFTGDIKQRFWASYLVAFSFVLTISLGNLFFVMLQHLTRAGWSVTIRRPAEILAMNLFLVAVLFLPIAWTVVQRDPVLYAWTTTGQAVHHSESAAQIDVQRVVPQPSVTREPPRGETVHATEVRTVAMKLPVASQEHSAVDEHSTEGEHHEVHKPYLAPTRFLVSAIVYFVIWCGLAWFFFRTSTEQDRTADYRLTLRMEWWSGIAMVVFGFTLTYAAFDFLMSLAPHWYSTIFGVYVFSGCAMSGIATLLLVVLGLRAWLPDASFISDETQRDLGRLLFAFVFFWAYIAFSQYMLLWYANVPETASWLVRRGMSTATEYRNSWGWIVLLLLFGHFLIPFLGIMSRHVKSNSRWMVGWCLWLLLMQYIDLYWIVMPTWYPGLTFGLIDIGMLVVVSGIVILFATQIASRPKVVPVGDPRLAESLVRDSLY